MWGNSWTPQAKKRRKTSDGCKETYSLLDQRRSSTNKATIRERKRRKKSERRAKNAWLACTQQHWAQINNKSFILNFFLPFQILLVLVLRLRWRRLLLLLLLLLSLFMLFNSNFSSSSCALSLLNTSCLIYSCLAIRLRRWPTWGRKASKK